MNKDQQTSVNLCHILYNIVLKIQMTSMLLRKRFLYALQKTAIVV